MICGISQIRHLVISGGAVYGLSFYGCLKHLEISGVWNINDIKSMYCTSIGSMVSVILSITQDWDILDNYFINRPWNELYKTDFSTFVESYTNCGIFGKYVIEETVKPILESKNIDINISMKELFELTNIDIHIFSTQLETLTEIDISYKTHPDWKVIDAIYASCCFPILFKPLVKNSVSYIDGGVLNNYPLKFCVNRVINAEDDLNSILGISILHEKEKDEKSNNKTLITYLFNIINMLVVKCNPQNTPTIENEIFINSSLGFSFNIFEFLNSKEERKKFINYGKQSAFEFLAKKQSELDMKLKLKLKSKLNIKSGLDPECGCGCGCECDCDCES